MDDKLPPCAEEAEIAVAGCVLWDSLACLPILRREGIGPRHFYDKRREGVLSIALALAAEGKPADDALLLPRLKAAGIAADYSYLGSLRENAPAAANVEYYLPDLKAAADRRLLIRLAQQALNIGQDEAQDPAAVRDTIEQLTRRLQESFGGNNSDWLQLIRDGAETMRQTFPEIVQLVEGLIAERCKVVIGSGSKSFKTWLTIYIALCISHAQAVWGRRTERRRVLYVNLELKPDTFERRLQIIARHLRINIDATWFHHVSLRGKMAGVSLPDLMTRIIAMAKHCEASVIVLDPVYKANTEGDENSSRDQTVFFNQLDRITTEAECTLILNDHFGKGNQSEKDPLDAIRGSSAKGGDVDAAIILRRHEVQDCFRVDVIHRELPPVEPFCIGWNFPLMELRTDLDPEEMKKVKGGRKKEHGLTKLLCAIEETTEDNPVTITAWAKTLNMNRNTLNGYTGTLRAKGFTATVGDGTTARQYITNKGLDFLESEREAA
jgi:predicted transcriptional regulator